MGNPGLTGVGGLFHDNEGLSILFFGGSNWLVLC